MLRAGPFELEEALASGGQGEVWRARHTRQRVAVAVKLLTGEHARDPNRLRAFHNEVRAVAALDHENIVWVYDHGTLDAAALTASAGRFRAGTPWLAMELARSGSLATRLGNLAWAEVASILLDVLGGLAHAHARGVLHRDLKPENVLMDGGRAKLSDFGLGLSLHQPHQRGDRAGTPSYMAPEQFEGGDLGPWTDLYALGCLAFALTTGGPPFPERGYALQHALHANRSLPPLRPRLPLPRAFEAWIHGLTARRARDRYRHAADAATDLRALGEPEPPRAWHEPSPSCTRRKPDVPESAGPSSSVARSIELADLGLGLFGVRAVPVIGRERECARLWASLVAVVRSGVPRAVALEGPAGSGKSHLARWLGERAAELGVATMMRAAFAPGPTRDSAVVAMLRDELERACVEFRVGGVGAEAGSTVAATGPMAVSGSSGPAGATGEGPAPSDADRRLLSELRRRSAVEVGAERETLAHRLLDMLARERALVVWLDDVHESREAWALVARALRNPPLVPVLFVLTSRDSPDAELGALPGLERVEVGPLGSDHLAILVRRLLPLRAVAAARVVERAGGSPLFAAQLVGNWVERGALQVSKDGYNVVGAAGDELPASLYDVWSERLKHFLEPRPPGDRAVLELAAALGQEVDDRELERLAHRGEVSALVDAFVGAGLARRVNRERWSFIHGLLRETIASSAIDAGRAELHHRRCAAMLRDHGGDPGRIGRHELAGGRPEAAVDPLLGGARSAIVAADSATAVLLLDEAARAIRDADLPDHDVRRGWLEIRTAQAMRVRARHLDAVAHIERAFAAARRHGWKEIRAEALVARAAVKVLGMEDGTSELLAEALLAADASGSAHLRVLIRNLLGNDGFQKRQLGSAARWFEEAIELAEADGDDYGARPCWLGLCHIALVQGDLTTARDRCTRSLACAERIGSRTGRAYAMMTLGELARLEGDLGAAETLYRDCLALYTVIDHAEAVTAELNLGTTILQRGDVAKATAHYQRALASAHRFERTLWVAAAHVCLLAASASGSDDAAWSTHAIHVAGALDGGKPLDEDFVRLLRLAAERASGAGYPERVTEAEALIALGAARSRPS